MKRLFWLAALTALAACQPKVKSERAADAPRAEVPENMEFVPPMVQKNPADLEKAHALLLALSANQEIEDHILIREQPSPEEQQIRTRMWNDLTDAQKGIATLILRLCQVSKKQTKPDLSTLSPTAKFDYGSDIRTEGPECPVIMSRMSTSHGQVLDWKRDSKTGSYRVQSMVKTVTEFNSPEHQQTLGMIKGEFNMSYVLDALRLAPDKRRTFLRAEGQGFILFTNRDIGRVELKFRGQELHKENNKMTIIHLDATAGTNTFTYTFYTEGLGLQRELKRAFVGGSELSANEIERLKVKKLANKLSLSVN